MLAGRRPAWMGRPYSDDLRERVVRAVTKGGLSRHQAAAQFGVSISTAINWVQRFHETGSVKPDQIGGYLPKTSPGFTVVPFPIKTRVWSAEWYGITAPARPTSTSH